MQWELSKSSPLGITNGLPVDTFYPYRGMDQEIISNMLNTLPNNQTTVKDNLLRVVN
jgi:hypothetical protein